MADSIDHGTTQAQGVHPKRSRVNSFGGLTSKVASYYLGLKYSKAIELAQEVERDGLVLDLGCGSGPLSNRLVGHYRRVIALEIDRNYLKPMCSIEGLRPLHADARKLPLASDSVDAVFTIGVLEHLPRAEEAVSEVHRVLKEGGLFIAGLPIEVGLAVVPRQLFLRLWGYRGHQRLPLLLAWRSLFTLDNHGERHLAYHVDGDEQFDHLGFNWRATVDQLKQQFRVLETCFLPLPLLRSANPYVLVKATPIK